MTSMAGSHGLTEVVEMRMRALGMQLEETRRELEEAERRRVAGMEFLQAIKTASGETAPTLQSLNNIVDTMLAHVSAMTHLRYIDLDYASGFRAEGIKHLYRLPQLKMLFFTDTDVSDSALEGIGALTSLKLLELARTKVTDADLPHRIGLCSLEQLSLSGCMGVMNVGLVHVGRLTRLQELRLFGTAVTDDGLQQLTALTKLKSLWTQADYVRSVYTLESSPCL
ncbi:unnamed protein product [Closterium sp. NIES-53]